MKTKALTLLAILSLSLGFYSCSSDDDNNDDEAVKYTTLDIPYTQGEKKFGVDIYSIWKVENTADWAYCVPKSGKRGESTKYLYQENSTSTTRFDTLSVYNGSALMINYILRQAANPNK